MGDQTSGQTVTTPELRALLEKEGIRAGRYWSVERGRAQVEVVTPEGSYTVTVIDPKP